MTLSDSEFGEILVRKNRLSTHARFSVSPSGRLSISVPERTSDARIRSILDKNRAQIKAKLPLRDPTTQRARDAAKKLLAKKAKAELPYRLEFLASKYGYRYARCRLSHAGTRWGSCSSSGTISLNIALMQIPAALRDYVLLHELAHLRQMNHSADFWSEVASTDPMYKRHRKALKMFSPSL